jgi:hypothetical protein
VSGIGSNSNQPAIKDTSKVEAVEKKTMLDNTVDFVKEHTEKGSVVGDHYVFIGASTLGMGIPAVVLANKLAPEALKTVAKTVFSQGTGGAIGIASSVLLTQDGYQSIKEGKTKTGIAELGGATVIGLGGVELVGRQFNIPVLKEALSTPAEVTAKFVEKNWKGLTGAATIGGSAYLVKTGIDDIQDGKNLKGYAKAVGGAITGIGGVELVGRQFDIPVLKEALTGPVKWIAGSKGGQITAGAVVGGAGLVSAVDGVRRLATKSGIVNDIAGTAEVVGAVTAGTAATSIIGNAIGNDAMKKAFPENADVIGAVALGAGATGLAKFTAKSIKNDGVNFVNATTGTAAIMTAAGAVEVIGSKFGIPVAKAAFEKTWQPALAAGLGAASYKFGKNAFEAGKEGSMGQAAGNAAGAVVLGASSIALAGYAFKIPVLEKAGGKILEGAYNVAKPFVETAVEHPALTLTVVGAATAVGAYSIYQHNKNKAETPAK